jgi:hypothetical protein
MEHGAWSREHRAESIEHGAWGMEQRSEDRGQKSEVREKMNIEHRTSNIEF